MAVSLKQLGLGFLEYTVFTPYFVFKNLKNKEFWKAGVHTLAGLITYYGALTAVVNIRDAKVEAGVLLQPGSPPRHLTARHEYDGMLWPIFGDSPELKLKEVRLDLGSPINLNVIKRGADGKNIYRTKDNGDGTYSFVDSDGELVEANEATESVLVYSLRGLDVRKEAFGAEQPRDGMLDEVTALDQNGKLIGTLDSSDGMKYIHLMMRGLKYIRDTRRNVVSSPEDGNLETLLRGRARANRGSTTIYGAPGPDTLSDTVLDPFTGKSVRLPAYEPPKKSSADK